MPTSDADDLARLDDGGEEAPLRLVEAEDLVVVEREERGEADEGDARRTAARCRPRLSVRTECAAFHASAKRRRRVLELAQLVVGAGGLALVAAAHRLAQLAAAR